MDGLITVGVDGSATGREALRFALWEAALRGARVRVVHAWTIPALTMTGVGMVPTYVEVEDELAANAATSIREELERVGKSAEGVEIEQRVVKDDAGGALVGLSADADLLVVGSRGRGAVASAMLGSVSQACLHHASCPVAVVHVAHYSEHSRLVVGVDGSQGSAAALEWAFAEARLRGVAVHALCAYQEPWGLSGGVVRSPEAVQELRQALRQNAAQVVESVERAAPEDVAITGETVAAPAGHALVAAASDADMLVLGTRGRGGFASLTLGSVSRYCASHAGGVVVVVRPT
jgi:nucleotide-binding universal stress UspA family protein